MLGRSLSAYARRGDVVVIGLPRGGVEVAYEIAMALQAPLDVLVVRKIGIPGSEEAAMGAIASGGIEVIDRGVTQQLGISCAQVRTVVEREHRELLRREAAYRRDREPVDIERAIAIVADDGLATGSTMLAAVTAVRMRQPARIVIAVPVGSPAACRALRAHVDELCCLIEPHDMEAVGHWYEDFGQTTDDEVRELLERAARYGASHGIRPSSDHRHGDSAARRPQ